MSSDAASQRMDAISYHEARCIPSMDMLNAMKSAVWTDPITKSLRPGVIGIGFTYRPDAVEVYVDDTHPMRNLTFTNDAGVVIRYRVGMPTNYVSFLPRRAPPPNVAGEHATDLTIHPADTA